MKPCETERLTFKELANKDFASVHDYAADSEVSKFMVWGPNTPDDTISFLTKCQEEQRANPRIDWTLGIIRKSDQQLIGVCSLHVECFTHKAASIGYALHRNEWGNGYASEAAKAVLQFGFDQLAMHRIWATCRPNNERSANVLLKLGMKYEGRLQHHVLVRGQWLDSLLFAIVDE